MNLKTQVPLGRARVRNLSVDPKSSSFQDSRSGNTPSVQLPPQLLSEVIGGWGNQRAGRLVVGVQM